MFDPEINLRFRSFDVHGRWRYLESSSRRAPGSHSCPGRPPPLRLSVRLHVSRRTSYRPYYPVRAWMSPPWRSHPSLRQQEPSNQSPRTLTERMRLNGFLPTNLVGKDAKDWREMIISSMFPAMKPKPGMASDTGVDADPPYISANRRHPGSFNPAGSVRQLPRMNLTRDSEPITSKQKPSLAYIILGPKTRGKLDAKKADELGLKGKLRGLVASGSTVTFTTTDANGKQIERTVKPEECVGPGENPAVGTELQHSLVSKQLTKVPIRWWSSSTSPPWRIYLPSFPRSRNRISTPSSGRERRKIDSSF